MSTELLADQPQYTDFTTILSDERFKETSGLDMAPTIEWYTVNKGFLLEVLNRNLQFAARDAYLPPTVGLENLTLDRAKLKALRGLFPQAARNRSVITTIKGDTPRWFHRDSLHGGQQVTLDSNERLSPTSIIPGYTGYRKENNQLVATLELYRIPAEAVEDFEVASLITAEADFHEEVHGITGNLMYGDDFLLLPGGRVIEGFDFVVDVFGNLAEAHPPISHYSSHFRDDEGNFTTVEKYGPLISIGEELAETTTTLRLGYGSGNLTNIQADPLADRPELKKVIRDLLEAKIVSEEEAAAKQKISVEELKQRYLARTR